jgi:DNA mismatch repair ATPase MutS
MVIIDNEGILNILDAEKKDRSTNSDFIVDKQTMEDLNLLGRFKPGSIYSLFNNVKTRGGQRILDEMFRQPMKDISAINQRTRTFRYFQYLALKFPFQYESLILVESYLAGNGSGNIIASVAGLSRKKLLAGFVRDEQFTQLQAGLAATVDTLKTLVDLLNKVEIPQVRQAKEILTDRRLSWLTVEDDVQNFSVLKMARYDLLLRHTMRKEMDALLDCLYRLDVYIAVSDVARQRGFSYAQALPSEERTIRANALWHPAIENATANPIDTNENSNVLFLTGANMAGKSTFMKSFGIAVYLAHMGFPVAARDMSFSVRDGLYSSINVADDLNRGYSHFYAEVLRVKTVAEQVSKGMDLVVIFDELFKGTNVKDAFDATLQVTASLARYRNCFYIVSTHIIEVGETLRNKYDNIKFAFLPTFMDGAVPRYTYRLNQGITVDRHGMVIIANEKILEALGYME